MSKRVTSVSEIEEFAGRVVAFSCEDPFNYFVTTSSYKITSSEIVARISLKSTSPSGEIIYTFIPLFTNGSPQSSSPINKDCFKWVRDSVIIRLPTKEELIHIQEDLSKGDASFCFDHDSEGLKAISGQIYDLHTSWWEIFTGWFA